MPPESAVILYLEPVLTLMGHADDDGEGSDVHQSVDQEVKEHGARGHLVGRYHRNDEVSAVSNAGVSQHSFHIGLNEGDEVRCDHGDGCQPPENGEPFFV